MDNKGDLIRIQFIEPVEDFSKGAVQEMIYDMGKGYILDEVAEEITKEEYDKVCMGKQVKQIRRTQKIEEEETQRESEQLLPLDQLNFSPEKIAITILDLKPIYYDSEKRWFGFDEEKKRWTLIDEIDILTFIKKTFSVWGLSSSKMRTEMLNALKDEARFRTPKKILDYQIQIGKNIYDMRNDDFFECSKEYKPNIVIPHDIDTVKDDEECTYINNLFEAWVGEKKEILYDIIAFTMSPKYFLDICFWLVGTGENGKGLFQTILHNVIGEDNVTAQDLELISDPKDRFTKGFLRHKLLCSLGDGNYGVLEHAKALKTLSGCTDYIRSEIKGGSQLNFHNQAKMLGAYNTLPESSDKTAGFYRRQHITEFKNDFEGQKNPIPNIPQREYTILAKRCWDRLKEMYKTNEIKGWGTRQERKKKYELLSNPIGVFIEKECIEDYDEYIFPKTLYKAYTRFALKNGYNQFRLQEFEARLQNQGYEKKRKDVYHYTDLCWGKYESIPSDIDIACDNNVPKSKYFVWFGLKINTIDTIDTIDSTLGLETPIRVSESKPVSIVSIVSISNKILKLLSKSEYRIDEILELLGADSEKNIIELLSKGDIIENPRGTVRLI